AILASSLEVPSVLEFLQRRKLEAKKAKELCLELVSSIIIERRPLPMVFRAIDVLVSSFAHSLKTCSYSKGKTVKSEPASGVNSRTIPNSVFLTSDSEDNANFKKAKDKFLDINSSSGNVERKSIAGAEAASEL
nr:colon cancer-associated Mic1-like protein [Tanacetum cinerariifolium]